MIEEAWAAVRAFFDQPEALKHETDMGPDYPYGYNGMQAEMAGNELKDTYGAGDMKESWQACLGARTSEAYGVPAVRWPRAPDQFKSAFTAYYYEMEALANRLLLVFARALGVADDWFKDKADKHWCALRALNYPHQTVAPAPGALRIAPHSDYGTLTILRADDAPGGLQVQMADGSWADVVIPPDAFVINLGDLMQRWTNDKWRSTRHRVVNPPLDVAARRDTRRQSMAFFHNLNRDVTVETIATCIDASHPATYPPINAFEHLMQRHAAAVGASKAFTVKEEGSSASGAAAATA